MSEWQPIETAPRDFTPVLVALAKPYQGQFVWIATCNPGGDWSSALELIYDDEPLFYLNTAEELGLIAWMPLPEPPHD